STTGYHLRWPKKNSTHCPGWVDHYKLSEEVAGRWIVFERGTDDVLAKNDANRVHRLLTLIGHASE
ncbi:hypothetical protein, partial [Pseudomonas aeruginosa]|uniref:hypothetical protein n=1 Tax=Pseudomonas aeruginosa TaxID=287 RepID=UPI003D2CB5EB